jgi:hypothetical protein
MTKSLLTKRMATHGAIDQNFNLVSRLWSEWTGNYISPHDVAMMQLLLKVARIRTGDKQHKDHYLDIKGYAEIAERLVKP